MLLAPADMSTMNATTQMGLFLQDACAKKKKNQNTLTLVWFVLPELRLVWEVAERGEGVGAVELFTLWRTVRVRCFQQQAETSCALTERGSSECLECSAHLMHYYWNDILGRNGEGGVLCRSQTSEEESSCVCGWMFAMISCEIQIFGERFLPCF